MRTRFSSIIYLLTAVVAALPPAAKAQEKQPNIVITWGDDVGQSNISAYTRGMMG